MLNAFIVLATLVFASYLAFSRRLEDSSTWKAMVTPLASIMGSGFLVCAPLLGSTVGNLAAVCMGILLVLAYGVGDAIRFNIRHFEPIEHSGPGAAQSIAFLSQIVLSGAYFISVTYYLQLLAAFVLNAIDYQNPIAAHAVTTALLLLINGIGIWRGLGTLENLEKYTVALNLGMIGSLLLALLIYNVRLGTEGSWQLPAIPTGVDFKSLRVLLGLLIVVQGFETSRYLGDEHPADVRIATMRLAQIVSGVIYLIFLCLSTVLFTGNLGADVTGIITMTQPVALVLPVLLSITAIGSQFSAAVADNEGAGGLIEDITHRKVSPQHAYWLILIVSIVLTWETDVTQIIAYASRAFALYYTLQCLVAFLVAWESHELPRRTFRLAKFAVLSLACLAVFALGLPAE